MICDIINVRKVLLWGCNWFRYGSKNLLVRSDDSRTNQKIKINANNEIVVGRTTRRTVVAARLAA